MRFLLLTPANYLKAIVHDFRDLKPFQSRDPLRVEIETLSRVTERASLVLSGISILFEQSGSHLRDPQIWRDYRDTLRLLSSLQNVLDELNLLLQHSEHATDEQGVRERANELLDKNRIDPKTKLKRKQCYDLLEEKLCAVSKKVRLKSRPLLHPQYPLLRST